MISEYNFLSTLRSMDEVIRVEPLNDDIIETVKDIETSICHVSGDIRLDNCGILVTPTGGTAASCTATAGSPARAR